MRTLAYEPFDHAFCCTRRLEFNGLLLRSISAATLRVISKTAARHAIACQRVLPLRVTFKTSRFIESAYVFFANNLPIAQQNVRMGLGVFELKTGNYVSLLVISFLANNNRLRRKWY